MQRRHIAIATISLMGLAFATCASFAQQTLGERVGEGLQNVGEGLQSVGRGVRRGVQEAGDVLKRQFETVRADVNRMGVQSRVYSRLHWERSLHQSRLEVHMMRDGTALLRGAVPDQEARERAVEITRNTVGITSVIDELTPLVPPEETKPTASRRSSSGTQSR